MLHLLSSPNAEEFRQKHDRLRPVIEAEEGELRRQTSVDGYCVSCSGLRSMTVNGGPDFGPGFPNLREGLVCVCGAKNRDRLMILASKTEIFRAEHVIFFGVFSGWANWARLARKSGLTFCEFFSDVETRGETRDVNGIAVRNEDLTSMTFAEGSADVIVHQDVLEHIPDFKAALQETLRVLKPGGRTIFTAPFFHTVDETIVRAVFRDDGTLEHLLPEERHGDPLTPEGILAFYNFGWSLLDDMREAGFSDVALSMVYSADLGLVSNGCPGQGNMLPVYLTGTKAS